jgi:NAD(P)-dependent dehydrogenase (short-subunit alcohol dehydrogenase family)
MLDRNPLAGPDPSGKQTDQPYPGTDDDLKPGADHGETSYEGCGKLKGLVAIVTGGDSGIGRAVAIAFAREGADVAMGYLGEVETEDAEETRRWVEEAGRRCLVHRFDVREPAQCRDLVERTVKELGGLDVLVNNAAYQMSQESVLDITPEQLDRTFRTNVFGYLQMVQAALPHLKEGSAIIQTGSVTAFEGNPRLIDYSATKGAIHNLTLSLSKSLKDKKIRVNTVAPGPVWTPLIPSTFPHEHVVEFGKDTLWERPAQPAEIATSYVFLASADARFFSGEVLSPTGKTTSR